MIAFARAYAVAPIIAVLGYLQLEFLMAAGLPLSQDTSSSFGVDEHSFTSQGSSPTDGEIAAQPWCLCPQTENMRNIPSFGEDHRHESIVAIRETFSKGSEASQTSHKAVPHGGTDLRRGNTSTKEARDFIEKSVGLHRRSVWEPSEWSRQIEEERLRAQFDDQPGEFTGRQSGAQTEIYDHYLRERRRSGRSSPPYDSLYGAIHSRIEAKLRKSSFQRLPAAEQERQHRGYVFKAIEKMRSDEITSMWNLMTIEIAREERARLEQDRRNQTDYDQVLHRFESTPFLASPPRHREDEAIEQAKEALRQDQQRLIDSIFEENQYDEAINLGQAEEEWQKGFSDDDQSRIYLNCKKQMEDNEAWVEYLLDNFGNHVVGLAFLSNNQDHHYHAANHLWRMFRLAERSSSP